MGIWKWNIFNTPKLVAGLTELSCEMACTFYSSFVNNIIKCNSLEIAETAKLLENSFRFINISFVNQISMFCSKLGIDINEVLSTNYDIFVTWKNTIKMPTVTEYNDYINKMREESKIKTMAVYNVLEDDDLQLMKDMKRFGFKIEPPTQVNPEINPEGGADDPSNQPEFGRENVQDYEGEREFYPDSPDKEMDNDEKL